MRSWVGTNRADIGELAIVMLPFGMARVALNAFDSMLAHEAAHLLLGAQDEYHDAGRVKKEYTDNSLMAEDRKAEAKIKARHLEHLVQYVAAMFPDRSVSIVE